MSLELQWPCMGLADYDSYTVHTMHVIVLVGELCMLL